MISHRFLFCQYANDVRQELGGTISIIGVYQGGLRVVGELPATLPKLTIVAHLASPAQQPVKSVGFRVLWNGTLIKKVAPPDDFVAQLNDLRVTERDVYMVQVVIALPQLQIEGNGRIDVLADVDGVGVSGNTLKVEIVPPQELETTEPKRLPPTEAR